MVGCVELDVQNPNDADAERALGSAGDVEALIAGSFGTWDNVLSSAGPTPFLSNAAGGHAAPWANFGMEQYARIPRVPTNNIAGASDVGNLTYAWYQAYRAISAVRDGLRQIADGTVDLEDDTQRAQAFGKFVQGIAHASVAVLYDSGFVYDETFDPDGEVPLVSYQDMMTAARGYFQQAIDLASGASFTIPESWMGVSVPAADLEMLAHSERARFSASVARTPAERQALDWTAIRADAEAGFINDAWEQYLCASGSTVCHSGVWYMVAIGWHMQNNWVLGMADQSGGYQDWLATPLLDKQPFIVVTPDTRWPQGADQATQVQNPGEYYTVNGEDADGVDDGSRVWERPDRGTWRWSYYKQYQEPYFGYTNVEGEGFVPTVQPNEMQALVAESHFYAGNMGPVVDYVNSTRTLHGLQATDAAGTNTDCVPRLPNGDCGGLWEMFKWEKRLENQFAGALRILMYFDGRGWGDLMQGTILQLPTPFGEMQLLERSPYNYGGVGGESAAPVGTYGY
jgi:hypothetical protein